MPAPDLWDITRPLAPVRYAFRVHGWKGPPWHVRRFKLHEALNTPYRMTLELVTAAPAVDLDELLGDACELHLDRHATDRTIHGIILAAEELGRSGGFLQIRLEIGPALALLAQRVDTRAWQEKTAPEILRDVLAPLSELGRSVRLDALRAGSYPRREYCVQYAESDLEFAARLMEEEGINYFFDHGGAAETLVLVDDNADFPACADAPLPLVDNAPDTAPRESIHTFVAGRRLVSTAVAQRNFDWTRPQAPLAATHAGADRRGRTREFYEHDDLVYPGDGERHARLKHERLALPGKLSGGSSNVSGLAAGSAFALHGHAHQELDGRYIVVRADHEGDCPDESLFTPVTSAPRYINTFEAAPLDTPLRPPRLHKKPKVSGLLTATVTGPPGEEVHCDEHGRIKILPHWDRLSPADDTSSWWVRVAQPVAGNGWGFFWLPRIGMEVIVDFLGGDPDRPIVLGCVYNGTNAPPYTLPGDKTKITLKSNSSPGGGGSNELRFEDQAGAEEVYLHAQKDWNTVVGASMSLSVGGSESDSIGGGRSTSVGADDSLAVGANATRTIGANLTETVTATHTLTVGTTETNTIGTDQTNTIGTTQINTIGTAQINTIGPIRLTTVAAMDILSVGAMRVEAITGLDVLAVSGAGRVELIGCAAITNISGFQSTTVAGPSIHRSAISLESVESVKMTTTGASQLSSVGGSRLSLVSGADFEMAAAKVTIASGGIALLDGSSSIVIADGTVKITGSSKVEIHGSPVAIDGDGEVTIKGGTIKLNC